MQKHRSSLLGFHGEFKGLKFFVEPVKIGISTLDRDVWRLEGKHHQTARKVTQVPGGNINCIEDLVKNLPDNAESLAKEIADLQHKIAVSKSELAIPFPQEDEFQKLSVRSAELAVQLDIDADKFQPKQQDDEKELRLNNIFSVEPQNFCQKKFFAIVKHTFETNDNDYSPKTESAAVKKLLEAGCSQSDIVDTLFKFSPIISAENDIEKVVSDVSSNLNQSKFAANSKVKIAASRSAGR